MGERGPAPRTRTRTGAAGSRADGPHGCRGEHRHALHGRAADDDAVPAVARVGPRDLGGHVNSLVVSNSAEENLALTRVHERLLTRMFHPHL
jgi:hypothetical protein